MLRTLTALPAWKNLEYLAKDRHFKAPGLRAERSFDLLHAQDIQIDLSAQNMDASTIEALLALAEARQLKQKISDLFQGRTVNITEQRPALHTALRLQAEQSLVLHGEELRDTVLQTRAQMYRISEQLRAAQWFGHSGKPIRAIVNIGIGGSDLGPRFCIRAFKKYLCKDLSFHFVSEVDPDDFDQAVESLDPETTLFIVASKSFSTRETLYNAEKALAWLGRPKNFQQHFIAVTAHADKAAARGYSHILPIWDWVGGRYSATSAINLITAIAIGPELFEQFLLGAQQMDQHFLNTEFAANLPVMLALLGIWNINFLHISNLLILTYAVHLKYFVPYIQQLDMESNGKSIDIPGKAVNYHTGPIVWGGSGNQAHHSYYQLLCQGTHKVAIDLISLKTQANELCYKMFMAKKQILSEGSYSEDEPRRFIAGGVPHNHIVLDAITPSSIGQLIALYEHKIYCQSVIWGINPFDQPGVEGAKRKLDRSMRENQGTGSPAAAEWQPLEVQ